MYGVLRYSAHTNTFVYVDATNTVQLLAPLIFRDTIGLKDYEL